MKMKTPRARDAEAKGVDDARRVQRTLSARAVHARTDVDADVVRDRNDAARGARGVDERGLFQYPGLILMTLAGRARRRRW